MEFGLGLSVDGGFANEARQERIGATQKAETLEASAPQVGLGSMLPSLSGGFGAMGQQLGAQNTMDFELGQKQREYENQDFISKLAAEAVQNQFITDQEAMAYQQMATTDPSKALEALSTTANKRRVDLQATQFVNEQVAPKIQELLVRRQKAMANRKAQSEKLGYHYGQEQQDPELAAIDAELKSLLPQAMGYIDQSMSQSLPEARALAKQKTQEYVNAAIGGGKDKGANEWARVMEANLRAKDEDRVLNTAKEVRKEVNKVIKDIQPEIRTLATFGAIVDELNEASPQDRAVALHPMMVFSIMSPGVRALNKGMAVTPRQRQLANGILQSINAYAKDISGAQVTVAEAARIFTALGLAVPASLGADAGTPTAMAEFQKMLADSVAKEYAQAPGKMTATQMADGINMMLELQRKKAVEVALKKRGVPEHAIEQYKAMRDSYAARYPEYADSFLADNEWSLESMVGLPPLRRIKSFQGADVTASTAPGVESTAQGIIEGAFGGADPRPAGLTDFRDLSIRPPTSAPAQAPTTPNYNWGTK